MLSRLIASSDNTGCGGKCRIQSLKAFAHSSGVAVSANDLSGWRPTLPLMTVSMNASTLSPFSAAFCLMRSSISGLSSNVTVIDDVIGVLEPPFSAVTSKCLFIAHDCGNRPSLRVPSSESSRPSPSPSLLLLHTPHPHAAQRPTPDHLSARGSDVSLLRRC